MDIVEVSRNAWNALRSEHQPVFDDLEESYRQRLLDRAQNVATLGYPTSEGGVFGTFEQNVVEALQPERFHPLSKQFNPDPIPEDVKEELVEEVKDEKEHHDLKGQLPADFPARDKLHTAGINTYGQLAKIEDLIEIDGVGPAIAKTITKRLKADLKKLNK